MEIIKNVFLLISKYIRDRPTTTTNGNHKNSFFFWSPSKLEPTESKKSDEKSILVDVLSLKSKNLTKHSIPMLPENGHSKTDIVLLKKSKSDKVRLKKSKTDIVRPFRSNHESSTSAKEKHTYIQVYSC